jgi:hypothetical protein
MIPGEVSFHCLPKLVPAYVRGVLTAGELIERLERMRADTTFRGRNLHYVIGREDFDAAIAGFANASRSTDRSAAAGTLVRSMLDPVAKREGKPSWCEKSLLNVAAAATLLSSLPDARVIHMVRDGRDAACSMVPLPVGRNSVVDALRQWALRLRDAERGLRAVPADRALVLHLENLVLLDRERSYRQLLDFVGLEDEPGMRSFFELEVTAERAHIGRWRSELRGAERAEIVALYEQLLQELCAESVSSLPLESPEGVAYGVRGNEPANPVDPWAGQAAPGSFDR